HRALPARAPRGRQCHRVRSARARPFLAAAAVLACAGRVGIRLGVDPGHAGRADPPGREPAGAAVARQHRVAGRPAAHAHAAVRHHGAEPAPHPAPGRAGGRQECPAVRGRRPRRNGPQPARPHQGAVRAHAAQRRGAWHRIAGPAPQGRQAGRGRGAHPRGARATEVVVRVSDDGRGLDMDVVANEIKQLGGSLAIESQPGQGTTFVLRLPFTLAVTQAILVRIGESTFAIPMTSVQGVARIGPDELAAKLAEHEPAFGYNGEQYGIHDLAELLGLPPGAVPEGEQPPLLLTRAGDLRAAIRIDAVLGSREIVVKSVGPQVSSVPGVLGATIMGDGSVLVILDLAPLVRHGVVRREQRLAEGLSAVELPTIEELRARPLVMVVDDSITMRKVTGRVLERHEYEVGTAKDGVDALEKLHERVPDLMLLDIEMPRMDGYELATHMKADPRLRDIPIIMITSRTGEKHRQRAFDIGVDRYLGKPYQEAELLTQIGEVLEQHAMALLAREPHHA